MFFKIINRFWAKIGAFFLKIWNFCLRRKTKKQMNWTLQNKNLDFQAQKEWKIALKKSQFSVLSCFYTEARTFFENSL
ncbi:MAG: hypothetical protein A3J76_04140 [Candidatus Moranbacteria bacterium RBG_13_45_13]|nr:MAG: hypothetical protein A3J76_04140 [Candidatus Moranbacteria bacterium RBG_13_45_13]